jgi:valyl-tRNA synthetase
MIMAGLELLGEVPFRTLALHGLVRDSQGRKLSKSLGNSPDPLNLFDQYGTDAVRVSIAMNYPMGRQDTKLQDDIFKNGQGLVIKLWNATRLLLGNLGEDTVVSDSRKLDLSALEDRWIISRLGEVIRVHDDYLAKSDIVHAVGAVRSFFWDDYCDWYLEIIKSRMWAGGEAKRKALEVALVCQRTILKLLHPYMPFVTEELWQTLQKMGITDSAEMGDSRSIALASWPDAALYNKDESAEAQIGLMASIVRGVRDVKQTLNISLKAALPAKLLFLSENPKRNFEPVRGVAQTIGAISEFAEHAQQSTPVGHVPFKFDGGIGYLALPSDIDAKDIVTKLSARIDKLQKTLAGIERNLANQDFVANAPAALVEETKGKAREINESISKLDDFRKSLQ